MSVATADAPAVADRDPEDLGAILYTSGTTGRSKGAMISHRALGENARALVDLWRWTTDDILAHALPINHVHGLFVGQNIVGRPRSEEHTSELQSLMRISYAVFCLKKKIKTIKNQENNNK